MDSVDPSFGSDKDGLVWGYLFSPGAQARPVDCEAAARFLNDTAEVATTGDFLWLHFALSNVAAGRWLRQHLSLPEAFHAGLTGASSGTRVEQEGESLIAVIHDVLLDFQFNPSEVSTVCLWVDARVMVSARPRPVRSLDRLRASVKAGEIFISSADLLAHLLQDQVSVLVEIIRQVTTRVDATEDNLLGRRVSVSRLELSALRRLVVRLQRLLAPEPAAMFRLLSSPPEWISDADAQKLRQSAEEFAASVADAAAVAERIKLLQEELAAIINEQNNRILFLLTLITVIALPFNLVGGVFGMNVGGIPFAGHPHGFVIVLSAVAAVTLGGAFLMLRRKE